ncbi:hypothetical protein ILUMI_12563 [Ignelater luminosus]|uniref:Uncharacterized protein n=1 Tax=Ignelater luminosus TaxID=2038154 RepID=A0A8K0GC73_IGNLU|nr:hypothetical protein ILUMI_12563 [Ignelater luminosus]
MENEHRLIETRTQYPQEVKVWAGILSQRIIGPFFIEGTLSGKVFLNELQDRFRPVLDDAAREDQVICYKVDGQEGNEDAEDADESIQEETEYIDAQAPGNMKFRTIPTKSSQEASSSGTSRISTTSTSTAPKTRKRARQPDLFNEITGAMTTLTNAIAAKRQVKLHEEQKSKYSAIANFVESKMLLMTDDVAMSVEEEIVNLLVRGVRASKQ